MVVAKNKKRSLFVVAVLILGLLFATTTVYGASVTANIYPGKNSDTSSEIKATTTSGKLTVENGGPNYYVQGYAKKSISYWPDSTVASLTVYPNKKSSKTFSATKGSYYYATINAQSGSSGVWGEAKLEF